MTSRWTLALLTLLLAISPLSHAQQLRGRKPSVGVALSGGGALGLAHIGVIQYFEERHIPIDRVAGTSMGGLVGGFYASGMDSHQMVEVVEQADWDTLLSPNTRFVDQPIVEKQQWNRTFGDFTLRFGKRFSLPAGLNPGEFLSLLLSHYTMAYSDLKNFDELPTPFRCVATDLIGGEAVVLGDGSLAKAMRATMSLPAVFTPINWDDKILVDGGLVQNIPVEVARSMGADTVIAVALETSKPNPRQLKSMIGVLRQTVSIAVAQNERRSLASADIVISVKSGKFSGTDYKNSKELIRAGYEAAKAQAAALARFELSPEEWNAFTEARRQRTRRAPDQGRVVAVTAPDPSFQRNAQSEIGRKLGPDPVSEKQLADVLTGMVAATGVPGASYQWQRGPGDSQGYGVEFARRGGQQVLARLGFHYGLSSGEPSRAELKVSTSTTFENAYKSRLLTSFAIGYDPGIRTEYYHPIGGTGYFFAPGLLVDRYHVDSYVGATVVAPTRDRFGGSFYAGIGTWRFSQLRVGVQAGYDSYSQPLVVDGVQANSEGFANTEVAWIYNTQDSGGLPTRGTRAEGSVGYSFRSPSYPYLRNEFTKFKPVGKGLAVFGLTEVGTSFGRKLNYYEQFTAGGQGRLSAYRYQEFHANTLVTAGTGFTVRGPEVRSFSIAPVLAVWYEVGRFDLGSNGWATHQSTSTGIFFPTPLGAAGVSVSFSESGRARFRLSLGSL